MAETLYSNSEMLFRNRRAGFPQILQVRVDRAKLSRWFTSGSDNALINAFSDCMSCSFSVL
jgi:hypothetical protein